MLQGRILFTSRSFPCTSWGELSMRKFLPSGDPPSFFDGHGGSAFVSRELGRVHRISSRACVAAGGNFSNRGGQVNFDEETKATEHHELAHNFRPEKHTLLQVKLDEVVAA